MRKISRNPGLRIILAIVAKDILEALKNHTILVLVGGVLALMLSAKALPLLIALQGKSVLAVVDPENSEAVQVLEAGSNVYIDRYDSEQEMKSTLVESQQMMIGLVVPADAGLDSGAGEVVLDGYYSNWVRPSWVREQVVFFETALSDASGSVVRIDIKEHVVYPTVEPARKLVMVTETTAIMILLMGLVLVPYQLLDEKEQRTLDALLVSPASYGQLVTGKALVGVIYCLLAALVAMLFNYRYVVHGEIILLAVLLGGTLAVVTGLLLGVLVENPPSLGMWMGIITVILVGPSVVMSVGSARLPQALVTFLSWTPYIAFNSLLKQAMFLPVQAMAIVKDAGIIGVCSLVIFALVVRRIRRMDR